MTFLSYSCFCCACDFGHKFWAEFWVVILVNGHVHNSLMMLVIILVMIFGVNVMFLFIGFGQGCRHVLVVVIVKMFWVRIFWADSWSEFFWGGVI